MKIIADKELAKVYDSIQSDIAQAVKNGLINNPFFIRKQKLRFQFVNSSSNIVKFLKLNIEDKNELVNFKTLYFNLVSNNIDEIIVVFTKKQSFFKLYKFFKFIEKENLCEIYRSFYYNCYNNKNTPFNLAWFTYKEVRKSKRKSFNPAFFNSNPFTELAISFSNKGSEFLKLDYNFIVGLSKKALEKGNHGILEISNRMVDFENILLK